MCCGSLVNIRSSGVGSSSAGCLCVQCHKPVIVAVHGACVGAGVDLICACDIRYCTEDALFQVKVCFNIAACRVDCTAVLELLQLVQYCELTDSA